MAILAFAIGRRIQRLERSRDWTMITPDSRARGSPKWSGSPERPVSCGVIQSLS